MYDNNHAIQCPKEHKDYRPITLTSVIMKSFERILSQHLVSITKDKADPCYFAYKKGCGTQDVVVTLAHLITKHLHLCKDNHARVLFLDFSSAFDTIQSNILVSKMVQLELNPYLIHWYASFLTYREQSESEKTLSSALTTHVCAPQCCVSSAILFSLLLTAVVLRSVCLNVALLDQTNTFQSTQTTQFLFSL